MCQQKNETIAHIVSACPKLAQKEYKRRRDDVARTIYWDLSAKRGFERSKKWYNRVAESVLETENSFGILVYEKDHDFEARRPDLMVGDKREQT